MSRDEQIAALQQKISEIDTQVANLQSLRSQTDDPSERSRIDAKIASLQETRQALETALSNLQSSTESLGLTPSFTPAKVRTLVKKHQKAAFQDTMGAARNSQRRAKELLKAFKKPRK